MIVKNAQLRGGHRYSFRRDEWADIIGIVMGTPDSKIGALEPRLCYCVRFADGLVDYIPVYGDQMNLELRAVPAPPVIGFTPPKPVAEYDSSRKLDIPFGLFAAAERISTFFATQGIKKWALGGCQSREDR